MAHSRLRIPVAPSLATALAEIDLTMDRWAAPMLPFPDLDDGRPGSTGIRGELLIADLRRAAHGQDAVGRQNRVASRARRLLCQAKSRFGAAAPVRQVCGPQCAA